MFQSFVTQARLLMPLNLMLGLAHSARLDVLFIPRAFWMTASPIIPCRNNLLDKHSL